MAMVGLRAEVLGIVILLCGLCAAMFAFAAHGQDEAITRTASQTINSTNNASIPDYVLTHLPTANVVGKSRLTMFFFKIYDATLFAPYGRFDPLDQKQPFALSLAYLRDFEGADIAQRSIDEMRDLGYTNTTQLAQWLIQMELSFPDITEGDVLTGVVDQQQYTQFYFNGKPTHLVADPEFTQAFFAIWLDPNTSQPKMRKQLLGERK